MEGKYISIKVIVDRLMRNPLMADIELEAAIDYAIQFMELVGNSNLHLYFENFESYDLFIKRLLFPTSSIN